MSAAKRLLNSTEKDMLVDFFGGGLFPSVKVYFIPSLVLKHLSVVCSNTGLGPAVQDSAGTSWKVKCY